MNGWNKVVGKGGEGGGRGEEYVAQSACLTTTATFVPSGKATVLGKEGTCYNVLEIMSVLVLFVQLGSRVWEKGRRVCLLDPRLVGRSPSSRHAMHVCRLGWYTTRKGMGRTKPCAAANQWSELSVTEQRKGQE